MIANSLRTDEIFGIFLKIFKSLHKAVADSNMISEFDNGSIFSANLPERGNVFFYTFDISGQDEKKYFIGWGNQYVRFRGVRLDVLIESGDDSEKVPCEFGYVLNSEISKKWPDSWKNHETIEAIAVRTCSHELRKEFQLYHGLDRKKLRTSAPGITNVNFEKIRLMYAQRTDGKVLKMDDFEERLDAIITSDMVAKYWVENTHIYRGLVLMEIAEIIKG